MNATIAELETRLTALTPSDPNQMTDECNLLWQELQIERMIEAISEPRYNALVEKLGEDGAYFWWTDHLTA